MAASPSSLGMDNCDETTNNHKHTFYVKFEKETDEWCITCSKPSTVLEAIKSNLERMERIGGADRNLIIQLGTEPGINTIATHFPCTLIDEEQILMISGNTVEESQKPKEIHPRDRYSIFRISTTGGENAKSKVILRDPTVQKYKYLCVYGEKGISAQKAIKEDGRFIDNLDIDRLSFESDPAKCHQCTDKVEDMESKDLQICLKRRRSSMLPQQNQNLSVKQEDTSSNDSQAPTQSQTRTEEKSFSDVISQSGFQIDEQIADREGSPEKFYDDLKKQFPDLRKMMEERYPDDDDYQTELDEHEETFGKIQQSFTKIHKIREMLELGESVCKLVIKDVCRGTGFVLFDNFIMTNAHLFKHVKDLKSTEVFALFNDEKPEPHKEYFYFTAKNTTFVDLDKELDYAIVELNPEECNPKTESEKKLIPAGLLNKFGPVPEDGEACIIGHASGEVKTMDPTVIIKREARQQTVDERLEKYRDMCNLQKLDDRVKPRGIKKIMAGGSKENHITYDTFMYHGASGSPVFDGQGRVIALHGSGFTFGFGKKEHMIEYASPLLTIFQKVVCKLVENKTQTELLKRIRAKAKGNKSLEDILLKAD